MLFCGAVTTALVELETVGVGVVVLAEVLAAVLGADEVAVVIVSVDVAAVFAAFPCSASAV